MTLVVVLCHDSESESYLFEWSTILVQKHWCVKLISKGTFWKKGTKWQSLVNSLMGPKCLCKYNIFLLYFNSNKYISKKNSKQCFPKRGMEMFLSTQSVWFNYVKVPRLHLIWHPGTKGALATVQKLEKEMQPLQWWLSPGENAISDASKIQKCNSWFSLDENAIGDISKII